MGTYIDIAEVAGLLFLAYLVGWLIGYFSKRIAAGPAKTVAPEIPADRLAAAKVELQPNDALVKAPIVAEVTTAAPVPHVPATATPIEPVKARVTGDGAVIVEASPIVPPQPVSALDTLKLLSETMPLMPIETVPVVDEIAEARAAAESEVSEAAEIAVPTETPPQPEPLVAVEPDEPEPSAVPEVVRPASVAAQMSPTPTESVVPAEPLVAPAAVEPLPPPMPATAPGVAWAGAINGHEAPRFGPPKAASVVETIAAAPPTAPTGPFALASAVEDLPAAEPSVEEAPPGLDIALLTSLAEELKVEAAAPATAAVPDMTPVTAKIDAPEPAPEIAEPVAAATPAEAPFAPAPTTVTVAEQPTPQPPPAPAHVEFDEDAAMRAIEGGWSRRAARALPDGPEMTDVSAAVSAAQVAVEQILARNGLDPRQSETRAQASFGKPLGLPMPRDAGRDDLKRINGLGPLDESTLNNLGIFHFDQIGMWDEREVLWLENHAFARGRIGREDWQTQARDLAARGPNAARANR